MDKLCYSIGYELNQDWSFPSKLQKLERKAAKCDKLKAERVTPNNDTLFGEAWLLQEPLTHEPAISGQSGSCWSLVSGVTVAPIIEGDHVIIVLVGEPTIQLAPVMAGSCSLVAEDVQHNWPRVQGERLGSILN